MTNIKNMTLVNSQVLFVQR